MQSNPPEVCVSLTDTLGRVFTQLSRAISRHAEQPGAMHRTDYGILVHLETVEADRLSDVAAVEGRDASTVSRRFKALTDAGLVARTPDPDDRRATLVAITDPGRAALQVERRARTRIITDALGDWSPQEIDDLERVFARLAVSLAEYNGCTPSAARTVTTEQPTTSERRPA